MPDTLYNTCYLGWKMTLISYSIMFLGYGCAALCIATAVKAQWLPKKIFFYALGIGFITCTTLWLNNILG